MKAPIRIALLMAALAMAGPLPASEVDDALAWFETLGLPNTKGLPYVEVATGIWFQVGTQPRENRFLRGFLVADDDKDFSVYVCDYPSKDGFLTEPFWPISVVHFTRKSSGEPYELVDYKKLDFETVARETLERIQKIQASDEHHWPPRDERGRIFALGRACQQSGLEETAGQFFTAAMAVRSYFDKQPATLTEALQQDMAESAMWQVHERFADQSISRDELAAAFESIVKNFPASRRVPEARKSAEILRNMIRANAGHVSKPLNEKATGEQVAELIYRLQDLQVSFWTSSGGEGPAVYPHKGGATANRLAAIGYGAVPQLIEALDDDRFTRSFVPTLHSEVEPSVMRVGEAAHWILDYIAGRHFNVPRDSEGQPLPGATLRKVVQDWWSEVQTDGPENTLIAAISTGDESSVLAAKKLAETNPAATIAAISKGLASSKHPGIRSQLNEIVASIKGDESIELLHAELAGDHDIRSRVAAAKGLIDHGHLDAITPMIEAWNTCQPALVNDQSASDDMNLLSPYEQVGPLIDLLAKSGNSAAIDALHHHFTHAPIDVRMAILEALSPQAKQFGMTANGRTIHVDNYYPRQTNPAADAASESLLVDALYDTARRMDMNIDWEETSFRDPRVCDLAALFLSKRWPERYAFDGNASLADRDRQIAKMKR